ncbi:MAG: hypothetical protein Q9174_005535 [Haloplaca sp. 1 TL-2023]
MADATRSGHRRTYKENFQAAVRDIDTAIKRSLPQSHATYENVAVLMLSWDNDNLGVKPLEDRLARVFTHDYNFTVERHLIQSRPSAYRSDPYPPVMTRLLQFGNRYDAPKTLLIYVYSGHARTSPNYDQCHWFGTDAPGLNPPSIDWLACRPAVDAVASDVLYIFGCCYATISAVDKKDNEYLVAAGMETTGSSSLVHCFTNRLVDVLDFQAGAAIAVSQIHAKMIAGMNASQTLLEASPVHIGATTKKTIVLERLVKVPSQVKQLQYADTRGSGKVLVSVKLRGQSTIRNVQEFQKWLVEHIPKEVASVKVEAVFEANSNSSICYFTLPIEVWGSLVGKEGFQLVDYVNSHNEWYPAPDDLALSNLTLWSDALSS